MAIDQNIDFKHFYLREFFGKAKQASAARMPENIVHELSKLLDNIAIQDDVDEGLGILARDRGASEVAMFMSDIIDNIMEQEPSNAMANLESLTGNFVDTMEILLKEEDIFESVVRVNNTFISSGLAASENRDLRLEEFLEKVFNEQIDELLIGDDDHDDLKTFVMIVVLAAKTKPSHTEEFSSVLHDAFEYIFEMFPWLAGRDFSALETGDSVIKNTQRLVNEIKSIYIEHPQFVDDCNAVGHLIEYKPEATEFIREEVPEEASSIESLLAEYFQADVNDHLEQFSEDLKRLRQESDSPQVLMVFQKHLAAFKEISMIHGYSAVEDFCSDVQEITENAKIGRTPLNSNVLDILEESLGVLSDAKNLKDANLDKEKTLTALVDKMHLELKADAGKPEASVAEQEAADAEQETVEVDQQVPEAASAEVESDEIDYEQQDVLIDIFKELIGREKEKASGALISTESPQQSIEAINRLKSGAELLANKEIASYLDSVLSKVIELESLDADAAPEFALRINRCFEEFSSLLSPSFSARDMTEEFPKLPEPVELSEFDLSDREHIFQVLCEIEKQNLTAFNDNVEKIFEKDDADARRQQISHFRLLENNFKLIGAEKLVAFPEYFKEVFETANPEGYSKEALAELTESYKLLIGRVEAKGDDADVEEVISILDEVLTETPGPVAEQEKPDGEQETIIPVDFSDEDLPEQIGEDEDDDMQEIFRQEAFKYLLNCEDALRKLKKNASDKDSYSAIESNMHSLKSSARLMNFDSIVALAGPLEQSAEMFSATAKQADAKILDIYDRGLKTIYQLVNGESPELDTLTKELDELPGMTHISDHAASGFDSGVYGESATPVDVSAIESDLGETDEDMMEIFKSESEAYQKKIIDAISILSKDSTNTEALTNLEYASHSLESAAKMLGFRSIGQIADKMEAIAVASKNQELEVDENVLIVLNEGIDTVQKLTNNETIDSSQVSGLIAKLNVATINEDISGEKPKHKPKRLAKRKDESQVMNEVFFKEAWELLDQINRNMVSFEKDRNDKTIQGNLYRNLHTLKGSAQMVRYTKIGNLAHKMEDFFELIQEYKGELPENIFDPVFNGVDEIQNIVESLKAGATEEESAGYEGIISELEASLTFLNTGKLPGQSEEPEAQKIVEVEKTPVVPRESEQVIRITTNRLDNLVNMAAELVISKTQLMNHLEKMKNLSEKIETDKKQFRSNNYFLDEFLEKQHLAEDVTDETKVDSLLTEFSESEFDRFSELQTVSRDFKEMMHTIDQVSNNFNNLAQSFEQNISRISNLTKMLHDDILQVRMVPVENLFNRFPRAVRDLAHKQGKKVSLIVEGEKTEMDRAMIESLSEPIMHIIRNAIDHGIEAPQERVEAGKQEDGILLLSARQDKNQIILEVQDDGRGIDVNMIRKTIVDKEFAAADKVEAMSVGEVLDFIFHPGFSTREDVSDVSGRGIGLDVVAAQLQKLKGSVRVNSTPGKGTIFSIRVPLTLLIAQAMLVMVRDQVLAIPLAPVEETIQFEKQDLVQKEGKDFLAIRGKLAPVAFLSELLDFGPAAQESSDKGFRQAIIIQEAGAHYVLVVDQVLRREEIVIKTLGEQLNNVSYIAGGTILGDGTVALILDTSAIARKIEMDIFGEERDFSSIDQARQLLKERKDTESKFKEKAEALGQSSAGHHDILVKSIAGRKARALIVDDSISVRRFVASVLERNNYDTVMAPDGSDALQKLENTAFDIIVTDLEMPKMHGFELIQKIREQKRFEYLPIIILSGRAGDKHRNTGLRLGANEFIIKPFKENDLIEKMAKFIESSD